MNDRKNFEIGIEDILSPFGIDKNIPFEEDFRRYLVTAEGDIKTFHIYLVEDIMCAADYVSILKVLTFAKENDSVIFHINSNGGDVSGALSLMTAIKQCKAQVVADVTSASSAATIITFACGKVILHYESEFMIHDRTSGSYGTGKDNRKLAKHQDGYFLHLTKKYYAGFLTDAEIAKINEDAETEWFFGDDLKQRMAKWAESNGRQFEYQN